MNFLIFFFIEKFLLHMSSRGPIDTILIPRWSVSPRTITDITGVGRMASIGEP